MTTVVPGLIKIGKTEKRQFEHRMKSLKKRLFRCNRLKKRICYRNNVE